MKNFRSFYVFFFFASYLLFFTSFLSSCATREYKPLVGDTGKGTTPIVKKEGVFHKVGKGETLWRIAQAYDVPVDDIIQSNNIPNVAAIEVGQLVLIPGALQVKEILPRTLDQNKDEFAWPVKGKVISYFNDIKGSDVSRGIDIQVQPGDAVKAAREGTVVLADYMSGYGQTVMVDHGDGFTSVYAKNAKLLVKLGDHVYKGDPIAEVGQIGTKVAAHFEIRKGAQATNPLYYLP